MKKFKKPITLILTLALVVSLFAGCAKNDESSTGSNSGAQEKDENGLAQISMMTFDFEGSPLSGEHSEEVISTMEEYTQTKVDFTWVPGDNYEERLGLTLASPDDMPMIIAVGSMTSAITSAAEAGAFWDLNDFMFDAEKYPNLSQANPNVNKSLTVNDQLIGVYRARPIGRLGMGYRADWAEALGIEEPKTIEDLYDMMYQFTYNDPDGNGIDDTYGLSLCKYTGPLDVIQTYFGVGNAWSEVGGQLVPIHQTPEYMEALNWLKKMYDDGLVYADWAVRDTSTWREDIQTGECGIYIDVLDSSRRIWDYFINNEIPAVEGTSYEYATMNLVGTINDKTLATSGYNGFFVITKAAKTEEDVAACLNFLDKMSDDAMITLSSYGLEGKHWVKDENGYLESLILGDAVAAKAFSALNQTVAYIPNMKATDIGPEMTDRLIIEEEIKAANVDYAVFNPAAAYIVNSETYSLSGANLDEIIDNARTQYICGEIDEEGLKAAWENWERQGGQAVIEEINAQHN